MDFAMLMFVERLLFPKRLRLLTQTSLFGFD